MADVDWAWRSPYSTLLIALGVGAAGAGCSPSIGSSCVVSTDCSAQGDRICDTAEPGGYCTVINCGSGTCPDNAVCVEFGPSASGCPYSDYAAPGRFAMSFCMQACSSDSNCRDGYVCRDPRQPPWSAAVLDNNVGQRICIAPSTVGPGEPVTSSQAGSVCSPPLPTLDAAVEESSTGDAAMNAMTDAVASDAETSDGAISDGNLADAEAGGDSSVSDSALDDSSADGPGVNDATLGDGGPSDATLIDAEAFDALAGG